MIFLNSFLVPRPSLLPPPAAAFITPGLAVAGVALAAIPIIIHLLNRRRFKTVEFAAMRFVLEAMRRNRRRLQFESWLLLAMRCLLVGLIGIALARPLGCGAALAGLAGRDRAMHLLVLDNSGSTEARLGERTTWELAREAASGVLEVAGGGDGRAAAFVAAAPASDVVAEPTFDLAAVATSVASVSQASSATDLAGALERAAAVADRAEPGERVVAHLFTDAARPALEAPGLAAAAEALAATVDEVRVYRPTGDAPPNAAVVGLGPTEPLVRRGFDVPVVGRVAGFGDVGRVTATWSVDGTPAGSPLVTPTPDPASLTASPGVLDAIAPGRPTVVGLGVTADDALAADDERLTVIERVADLPVLVVSGGTTGPARTTRPLLAIVLEPGEAGYVTVQEISDLELAAFDLSPFRAVVLDGVGGIDEPAAERLADFVRGGGALMTWLGADAAPEAINRVLVPRGLVPGRLARQVDAARDPGGDNLGLVAFDFDPRDVHPFLAGFRNEEESGLAAPYFRSYWLIEPPPADAWPDDATEPETVLAFAGVGDPAVLSHRLGNGRVVTIATSSSDPEWSVFSLSDNFAAFVHESLSAAVGQAGGSGWQNLVVGDRLRLPAGINPAGAAPRLVGDDQVVRLERQLSGSGVTAWVSPPLTNVGRYELDAGDERYPVVVNRPPQESDLRRADEATLRGLFGDKLVVTDLTAETATTLASEAERPDLGWGLLALALILAGAESAYAGFLGRRRG